MPIPDHGGFDLAVEISEAVIIGAARALSSSTPPARAFTVPEITETVPGTTRTTVTRPGITGQVLPKVEVAGGSLSNPDKIALSLNLAGTELRITSFVVNNLAQTVPAWMNAPPYDVIGGTIRVEDRLEVRGLALVIDFAPDAGRGQPTVEVTVDEGKLLSLVVIQVWLAQQILANPKDPMAYQKARASLVATFASEIASAARQLVPSLGLVTLVAPPSGLPVTGTDFHIGDRSVHVLFVLGGSAGNPSAISRSNLLRSTATGTPLDVAAVILSNGSLLRDLVCPPIASRLGLTAGSFLAGEPCIVDTPVPVTLPGLTIPGVTVVLNTLVAGIDEASLLHIVAGLTATGPAGVFTIDATVDTALSVSMVALPGGGGVTITVAQVGLPSVTSDVSIPAWVYIAAALTLGAAGGIMLTALLAVDMIGGLLVSGVITAGLVLPPFTVTVGFPTGVPVTVRMFSLNQSDAARRTITIGGVTILAPFRDHDAIVNLV